VSLSPPLPLPLPPPPHPLPRAPPGAPASLRPDPPVPAAAGAVAAACQALVAILRGARDASDGALRQLSCLLADGLGIPTAPRAPAGAAAGGPVGAFFPEPRASERWPRLLARGPAPAPARRGSLAPESSGEGSRGDLGAAAYGCLLACAALPVWSAGVRPLADPLFEGAALLLGAAARDGGPGHGDAAGELAGLLAVHRLARAGAGTPSIKVLAGARSAARAYESDPTVQHALKFIAGMHEAGAHEGAGAAVGADQALWWACCAGLGSMRLEEVPA